MPCSSETLQITIKSLIESFLPFKTSQATKSTFCCFQHYHSATLSKPNQFLFTYLAWGVTHGINHLSHLIYNLRRHILQSVSMYDHHIVLGLCLSHTSQCRCNIKSELHVILLCPCFSVSKWDVAVIWMAIINFIFSDNFTTDSDSIQRRYHPDRSIKELTDFILCN